MTSYEPRGVRRQVRVDGLELSALQYAGTGPDLVIVPGITTTATACDFLAHELARHHNVVAVDLRGRGCSDRAPAGRYRLDDYAGDLDATVTQLDLHRPVVVGHSLGARIVARWAAGRHDHGPLVLVDPPLSGRSRPYPTPWSSFAEQLSQAQAGTTAEVIRGYYPKWALRELEIRAQELPTCDVDAVRETHAGFETDEFEADWCRLSAPVALIHGAGSPMVSAEDAKRLAALLPHAVVGAVADAGHMVPWDNLPGFMAVFAETVLDVQRAGGPSG